MITQAAFDALAAEADRLHALGRPALTPKPAATLIVVDMAATRPRLLVGRRGDWHRFMPGVFVFPGGAVEPLDRDLAERHPLTAPALDRLLADTEAGAAEAAALALAAIRETFEETGLRAGTALADGETPDSEEPHPYAAYGCVPVTETLVPIARAITPPGGTHRFDTRFFCIERSRLLGGGQNPRPSEELEQVAWVDLDSLVERPLAAITRAVLQDVEARLAADTLFDADRPMPFYRRQGSAFLRDLI